MDKALITALIVALVEGLKRRGLAADLAPLAAIGLGIVLNLVNLVLFDGLTLAQAIVQGIIMGLSAIGLYHTGRASRAVLRRLKGRA
ncbi:MAG TPA: transposase [Firmicutes bacterium]|nr:transposase [Bacillota bacterium]